MKTQILYVDDFKTTRDQRWHAADGKVLADDCYNQVDELELPEGSAVAACETLFEKFQAIDAPVVSSKGIRLRSMSVGDIIVIDGKRFVCASCGFEAVS